MDDRPLTDPQLNGPVILDRSRHSISRRDIDYDALKVLYRLSGHGFIAYLVGGAVRDLLLGRRPADFDIGTDAHPNQIKKLFRNAFLIGRRFRLAHIKFQGGKVIEVSTFRRKPDEEELRAEREEEMRTSEAERARDAAESPGHASLDGSPVESEVEIPAASRPDQDATGPEIEQAGEPDTALSPPPSLPASPPYPQKSIPIPGRPPLKPIAFGTPQEDAFRRDITINALFYDIATYSVIDYVGGLDDLRRSRARIIGDPDESYTEDPVRIWRVIRHASRLGFAIEERTERAIPSHLHLLAKSAGSRLFEELNKDMKSGQSRPFFELARRHSILPVILGGIGDFYQRSDDAFARLSENLAAIDAAVGRGAAPAQELIYALLIWPWAKPVLADTLGDKPKALYEAFRETRPATQIPKSILLNAVQTLVIVEHMLEALTTGRMRWALKKRAHFAGASKICFLLVQGTFDEGEDPFERIFDERFGSGRPPEKRRRRRRPRRRKAPAPPAI
jgi:poly(A) polymerase